VYVLDRCDWQGGLGGEQRNWKKPMKPSRCNPLLSSLLAEAGRRDA
jgi:hypothetical protein